LVPPKVVIPLAEAIVFGTFTVPDRVRVPFTEARRVFRKVAGVSLLNWVFTVPDSVFDPKLINADEDPPFGPRPSRLRSRESVKPAAVPSNTRDPPVNPIVWVFEGVLFPPVTLIADVSKPSADPSVMITEPPAMLVTPV
jgi:hypothetical protein